MQLEVIRLSRYQRYYNQINLLSLYKKMLGGINTSPI